MNAAPLSAALLCAVLALPGCKIVPNPDPEAVAEANLTDAERMANWVETNWEPKVLPAVDEHTVAWADYASALQGGLEAVGQAYGMRPDEKASQYFFFVSGAGTVVTTKLESRAAQIGLDMDADGKEDIVLQLGPIVRGTALRDALPFVNFTDFRDQIEFAKLGRALNDRATANLPKLSDDIMGRKVTFTAVFGQKSATEKPLGVPLSIKAEGQ
ncbi:DUF2291 family protein [Thioclava electrotropha]|uniref:DUF2291 domain-containing protein n=1 Tax=Thioclava electrotropha TaxID=1549850 RepID=A0ABX6YZ66_9RHOB|nr:DUF2291 domain-containing protein [Thioclava electrotropha]QPZ92564.1 DUF2291 domain-containing protein [Thioclava electrotropha]